MYICLHEAHNNLIAQVACSLAATPCHRLPQKVCHALVPLNVGGKLDYHNNNNKWAVNARHEGPDPPDHNPDRSRCDSDNYCCHLRKCVADDIHWYQRHCRDTTCRG